MVRPWQERSGPRATQTLYGVGASPNRNGSKPDAMYLNPAQNLLETINTSPLDFSLSMQNAPESMSGSRGVALNQVQGVGVVPIKIEPAGTT